MQQLGSPTDLGAVGDSDRLVAEADPEQRNATGHVAYEVDADTSLLRGPGPRRQQDAVEGVGLLDGDLVVAPDLGDRPELGEVLDEVEDERVVVVDDEHARRRPAV